MAQGIWGGSALLVAFLWGVLGPAPVGAAPSSWGGSLGGVVLLFAGILGMVFHEPLAQYICGTTANETTPLLDERPEQGAEEAAVSSFDYYDPERSSTLLPSGANPDHAPAAPAKSRLLGIFYAFLTGVFGGSVNVPSTLTSLYGTKLSGIETLPSFGLGSLVVGLLVPIVYFNVVDKEALQETGGVHVRVLWLPGLISGTIWNLGNICSVYANSKISFAVAQPLMQCALLVSGILGIFVFKEIQGTNRIVTFFSFAVVLLGGAAMLAVFGPG
jgi:hypothetical protein